MSKVMSLYPGVRTRHGHAWISIICFTLAVTVSDGVELQTISQVAARCGENVTLTCEATLHHSDITLFTWLVRNKTCQYGDLKPDPELLCASSAPTSQTHVLTVTLLNVMPVNQGSYLCKLRSKVGVKSATTLVTVVDCSGSSNSFINESHAKCWFSGVYPSGVIHWFQGDVNLTNSASTEEEEDQHGRYKVWSTIDVQKGNSSQPYNCSLWIPSVGKYTSSRQLANVKGQKSSGSVVRLQGIFIMVEIMMLKLMT